MLHSLRGHKTRRAIAAVALTATVSTMAACSFGGDNDDDDEALTIYTGQHEDLVQDLTDAFSDETGIDVTIRAGDDAEIANQLVEEGDGTRADIFLSEEPGPISLVDGKGLLSEVDSQTLDQVDERLTPSSGDWMPYAARSRVMYYNPDKISEDDLPDSILDLTKPEWKGKFAYAPSGAFASTVSYLIDDIGEEKTLEWLKGIKANGINEHKNGKVRDTIEAGQHPFGLTNHYYWWRLADEKGGPEKLTSKIHYFDHEDAGSLLLASGAGIMKASDHQDNAQKFVAWLGKKDGGQQTIAASEENPQFPVAPGVESKVDLPSVEDLHPPKTDPDVFIDPTAAEKLILESGIS